MKVLHFSTNRFAPEFFDAVREMPGVELELIENWKGMAEDEMIRLMQGADILLASRAPQVPDALAEDPGKLKYICYLHGTMRKVIGEPIIRSKIRVTNWGDRAGISLGQDSFVLLLAVFRDLPKRILAVRRGGGSGIRSVGENLAQLNIGVYGFGFSAREFVRIVEPFGSTIRVYDPYVTELPEHCQAVDSLEELFSASQAIVIHAGLTKETEGSVTKELLAMLPDQGILINTARGAIIDQPALFEELKSGRLRAGLDVLWPDHLPEEHEARQWENLIWTCHNLGRSPWPSEGKAGILRSYQTFLDNIRAFTKGQPLRFEIDETRYARMT